MPDAVVEAPAAGAPPAAGKREEEDLSLALGVKKASVLDRAGKEHELPSLDLEDLADMEEMIGPISSWLDDGVSMRAFARLMWASLRKVGLSEEEVSLRKWKLKPVDVGRMLDGRALRDRFNTVVTLLKNSGFTQKKGTAGPLEDSAPASTGAQS